MLSTSSFASAVTLFDVYALCIVKSLEVCPWSYDPLVISDGIRMLIQALRCNKI